MEKQVFQLRPGDKISFGREIVSITSNGLTVPKGKCEVLLRNKRGQTQITHWNKHTVIQVNP